MKKHLPLILIVLVFLVGASVLLYPTVSQLINLHNQTRAVTAYSKGLSHLSAADYELLKEQAERYNSELYQNKSYAVTPEGRDAYAQTLLTGSSKVIGYLEIDKIDLQLPLYHTTDHAVLQIGVGHLEGSSLPIGGVNTHAVLSGHRGLPSAKLFTNLDRMEINDRFTIHVLDMELTYQVDRIDTVLPDEVESLAVIPGGDYVTLVTCTPYGVNTHRLLVRGTRVETTGNETSSNQAETAAKTVAEPAVPFTTYIIVAVILTIFIVPGAVFYFIRRRRK